MDLAKYCIDKTYEIIGKENITEIIEPSAGNGSFSNQIENCTAYDIEPEGEYIIKQNFLQLELEYKKNRLIIGNPPYGKYMKLAEQFYKKSIKLGDYISFILPISQFNNNIKLFDFDFIYSEDLGARLYSDKKVHCCLNIYKRPIKCLNKRPNYNLKDVKLKLSATKPFPPKSVFITKDMFDYNIRICGWGASIGKFCNYEGEYEREICIKINNDLYKNEIIELIRNAKWCDIYKMTATPRIDIFRILKYIKEQIPELS